VFVAIDPNTLGQGSGAESLTHQIVQYLHSSAPATGGQVRYPGERVLQIRKENLAKGIPVEPAIWRDVQAFL
jgi:3-dehydro-L-gulonate 2-dehydrogenase